MRYILSNLEKVDQQTATKMKTNSATNFTSKYSALKNTIKRTWFINKLQHMWLLSFAYNVILKNDMNIQFWIILKLMHLFNRKWILSYTVILQLLVFAIHGTVHHYSKRVSKCHALKLILFQWFHLNALICFTIFVSSFLTHIHISMSIVSAIVNTIQIRRQCDKMPQTRCAISFADCNKMFTSSKPILMGNNDIIRGSSLENYANETKHKKCFIFTQQIGVLFTFYDSYYLSSLVFFMIS